MMNIYVQLEKNANKYSFFLYITLDTCHEGRGACSRPPPTRVREKPRRKEPGCPWSQLQAWDICKDLELQEASPRSGSFLENGLPTDSFSEWPQMLSLLVSANFMETNLPDAGECGYLATSMQSQAEREPHPAGSPLP